MIIVCGGSYETFNFEFLAENDAKISEHMSVKWFSMQVFGKGTQGSVYYRAFRLGVGAYSSD